MKVRPAIRNIPRRTFALLTLAVLPAFAAGEKAASPTNYEMVEAPTAYVLSHGGYDLVTRIYENGGIFLRANVGFEEFLMFGFSANATNLIGNGTIEVQTPRLFVKFKVLDQKDSPVALGLGWDDRGYGTVSGGKFFPGLQKGFFGVVSHEFQELGYLQVHGGVNAVSFDNFDTSRDLGVFAGMSFAIVPQLAFNLEVDKLLNNFWQFNASALFNLENPLRVGVDLREINRSPDFSRMIRIQYLNYF